MCGILERSALSLLDSGGCLSESHQYMEMGQLGVEKVHITTSPKPPRVVDNHQPFCTGVLSAEQLDYQHQTDNNQTTLQLSRHAILNTTASLAFF